MIYLVHFDRKFRHARHYLGRTTLGIASRLERHREGSGSKLLAAVNRAGIKYRVVRQWRAGSQRVEAALEKRLKLMGGKSRICPACSGARALRRGVK